MSYLNLSKTARLGQILSDIDAGGTNGRGLAAAVRQALAASADA